MRMWLAEPTGVNMLDTLILPHLSYAVIRPALVDVRSRRIPATLDLDELTRPLDIRRRQ